MVAEASQRSITFGVRDPEGIVRFAHYRSLAELAYVSKETLGAGRAAARGVRQFLQRIGPGPAVQVEHREADQPLSGTKRNQREAVAGRYAGRVGCPGSASAAGKATSAAYPAPSTAATNACAETSPPP